MGGRGGTSGRGGGGIGAISKEKGVKNYKHNQTFYLSKPDGSYKKQKGSTFVMSGREFGIHEIPFHTAGKYVVTDLKTGASLGLSHTTKEAASLVRKTVKILKSDPNASKRVLELEDKFRKYKSK